jgi:DNA-binding response OmpR family regulator
LKIILIVEKNKHLRESYRIALNDRGYETYALSSGEEALRFLGHENNVDLVVLDLKMDNFKSITIFEKLLAARENFKIILNSASSIYKHNKLTWLADAFLVKPFSLSELRNTVDTLLAV